MVWIIAMPSFARKDQTTAPQVTPADTLSDSDKLRFEYFYLGAINEQTRGHLSAAFDLLNRCIEINPNAAEAYFSRGAFQSLLKRDTLALQDYVKANELSPKNNTYLERLAQFYIKEGKYDAATSAYEKLYDNKYNRSEVLDILVQLYNQAKNYPMMIQTLNRMETEDGTSEQITLQKMQVYDMQGNKKAAYNELRSLVQKHPYDANYKVMMGNWLMNNSRSKEALQTFNEVLKDDPDNTPAQMSMLDYYKVQKDDASYKQLLTKLLVSQNTPDDSKITLIRQLIADNEQHGGDSTEVLNVFRQSLAQPQASTGMMKMYAAYMQLKQMPKDSISNVLYGILKKEPEDAGTRLQLLQFEIERKNSDAVIALCRQALQYTPEEIAFYYFLGATLYQHDKEDEAIEVLQRGTSHAKADSDHTLVSDMYAIIGDILHGKNDYSHAYEAYDSCLQWKPDNYGCLNNYAYYISQNGDNLQKAESMSYKTIQAEPQNTTFLDTYAWILFMEKRYEEAKIYIDQAITYEEKENASAVIAEHAGDIHAMTGDTEKAVMYWEKALNMEGCTNKPIIQKKLKLKKYTDK